MSTQLKIHFNLLKIYVSKTLHYLWIVLTLAHFLLIFFLKKPLIFELFKNADTAEGFTKTELKQLLSLATKESYLIFNGFLANNLMV